MVHGRCAAVSKNGLQLFLTHWNFGSATAPRKERVPQRRPDGAAPAASAAPSGSLYSGTVKQFTVSTLNIENHYKKQAKLSHGLNTD